jgi:hypothetical protein
MQLKRILVSLLVVVLMLSATVFASAEDAVVLTAGAATLGIEVGTTPASVEGNLQAKPGDKIDVSITITNNPGVAKIQVSMAYDANFFAPVVNDAGKAVTESGIFKFEDSVRGFNGITSNDKEVRFTSDLNNNTDITATGLVAKASFTVKEANVCAGKITVKVIAYNANGDRFEKVEVLSAGDHKFVETENVPATCEAEGKKVSKCSVCNEVVEETLPATGHTEVEVAAVAATCAAEGKTAGKKCSVCDVVIVAQETIPATGAHTAETVPGTAATCTTEGTTDSSKCSVCGVELTAAEATEKVAHTEEVIPAVEPTASAEGATEGKKCSVCGEILVAPEVIPAKGNAWLWIVIAAVVVVGGGVAAFIIISKKK